MWRQLKRQYRSSLDRMQQTGKKAKKPWVYFDEMHDLLKDSDSATPQVLASVDAVPLEVRLKPKVADPFVIEESKSDETAIPKTPSPASSPASLTKSGSTKATKRKRGASEHESGLRVSHEKMDLTIQEQKRANELMEERNEILRRLLEK